MEGYQKFLGGGGLKSQNFKSKVYEAKLEFLGGKEVQNKKPSEGGVWIFLELHILLLLG